MFKILRKKGTFGLSAIGFVMVALVFTSFAWDTSRLMYYKVHNQNLASAIALSIANESGFYLADSTGTVNKGYLVTEYYTHGTRPNGFTGIFADTRSLAYSIRNKQDIGSNDRDFRLVDMSINDNYNDMHRFITGTDGRNGEVKVQTTLEVDLFFSKLGSIFGLATGSDKKYITNVACASAAFKSAGIKNTNTFSNAQVFISYVPIL